VKEPSETEPQSIGVVVVTRDSASPLRDLLPKLTNGLANVVVVDNRSHDDSADIAAEAGVLVVQMPTNSGYSVACNQGARTFGPSVKWVAFVNPDVAVCAEDLRRLTTDVPEDIWAVAPVTTRPDGHPQADVARPAPTPLFVAAMYLGLTRSKAPAASLDFDGRDRYYFTDVLSGSCFLVRRQRLEQVGGWDEAFFFNCEDIDICVRIAMAGGRLAVDRSVRVAHNKAHSSVNADDEARRLEAARAYGTFFQIHSSAWKTALVAATAYFGCVARFLVDRIRRRSRASGTWRRYSILWGLLWSSARQAYLGRSPVRPAHAAFLDP
jgi:N-acetylglucosaminyl-diphospho-decaprenol L-rhamnosyltransferase